MDESWSAGWVCIGKLIASKKQHAEQVLDIVEEMADKKDLELRLGIGSLGGSFAKYR